MNTLTIFGEGSYLFIYYYYYYYKLRLLTKLFHDACIVEEVAEKTKCHKMNVHPFTNKLGQIISPSF
jgi:hypothetical protein